MTNHTHQKKMIRTGSILAGISVALGAVGAHLLRNKIDEQSMETFQVAIRYQFYHAFAILLMGAILRRVDPKYSRIIFQLFIYGIIIFCGSLYALALRKLLFGANADNIIFIGGLTPIGGILFLAGWSVLAYKGYKFTDGSERTHRHHKKSSAENINEAIKNEI